MIISAAIMDTRRSYRSVLIMAACCLLFSLASSHVQKRLFYRPCLDDFILLHIAPEYTYVNKVEEDCATLCLEEATCAAFYYRATNLSCELFTNAVWMGSSCNTRLYHEQDAENYILPKNFYFKSTRRP